MGVFGAFFLLGFVVAAWATTLPTLQQRTGIGSGVIGLIVLGSGGGALCGMQLSGWLVDRVGARTSTTLGVLVLLGALNCLPLAHNGWMLAPIAIAQGFGAGCTDVGSNNQAVVVERGYGRPIMSAFHALFSIGGAAGSGFSALLQSVHTSYPALLLSFTVVSVLVALVCLPAMLPGVAATASFQESSAAEPDSQKVGARVLLLGTLAFLLFMSEGVVATWGALQAVHHLHQSHAAASLAYGVFATCMTIGRLSLDKVVKTVGPVRVVRVGCAVAALGILTVIVSGSYPLTLSGWAIFGIGLAGCVPQVVTAAGNLPSPKPGAIVARVVGFGYVGELGGPAIIGGASTLVGIDASFFIPFAFCALVGVLAFGTGPPRPRTSTPVEQAG